jgi:hypothetical protein
MKCDLTQDWIEELGIVLPVCRYIRHMQANILKNLENKS